MTTDPERNRLPFEPTKKRQKPGKNKTTPTAGKSEKISPPAETTQTAEKKPPFTKEEMAIPAVVSQRMVRRVAWFCGVPTLLGIGILVASYLLIVYAKFRLPNIAVLLVNMGCFGLGVVGITYGVLSASWDEERVGSKLGWQEFSTNWKRMVSAWRSTK